MTSCIDLVLTVVQTIIYLKCEALIWVAAIEGQTNTAC